MIQTQHGQARIAAVGLPQQQCRSTPRALSWAGALFLSALALLPLLSLLACRPDVTPYALPGVWSRRLRPAVPAACAREVHESWSVAVEYWTRGLAPGRSFAAAEFERLLGAGASSELRQDAADGVTVAVIIRNGSVFVIAPAPHGVVHDWTRQMLAFLGDAARRYALPDAYFHLTCSDWQLQPRSRAPQPGSLVLALNAGPASWDVPIPGHSHPADGWLATDFPSFRWEDRRPVAHWRGNIMCESFGGDCATRCTRIQLRLAAQRFPDLLDVRFTEANKDVSPCVAELIGHLPEVQDPSLQVSAVTPVAQVRAKFIVASSGTGTPSGLKRSLANGAVVLREASVFREYFEPALVPWQAYVPFDCRDSDKDCRVLDIVRSAAEAGMDEHFRGIGARGQAFARSHFTAEARACYIFLLLQTLQPFFEGGTGALPDAVAARLLPRARRFEQQA